MDSFGTHLRKLREANQFSRNNVRDRVLIRFGADMTLSSEQLRNWENDGTPDPGAAKLACIVEILEANYEDVFGRLVRPNGDLPDDDDPRDARRDRRRP